MGIPGGIRWWSWVFLLAAVPLGCNNAPIHSVNTSRGLPTHAAQAAGVAPSEDSSSIRQVSLQIPAEACGSEPSMTVAATPFADAAELSVDALVEQVKARQHSSLSSLHHTLDASKPPIISSPSILDPTIK